MNNGAGSLLDEEEFVRWREEADRAAEGARVQAQAGLHNWACFLAEQGAQLAIKALLHGLGRGAWGHDVVRLGQEVEEAKLAVPPGVAGALRRLSRHYIPARYPDAHPSGPPSLHYAAEDSEDSISDMQLVLAFVDESWTSLHD
ncbi:MAG: HEPN domain-containing protein [Actinomycetota bacterium]